MSHKSTFTANMCTSEHALSLYLCVRWENRRRKWHNRLCTCTDSPLLLVAMVTCSRLPSEDGSVISSESVKEVSGKGSIVQKATAQQKLTKEESRKSNGERRLYSFSAFHTYAVTTQTDSCAGRFHHGVVRKENALMHSQRDYLKDKMCKFWVVY